MDPLALVALVLGAALGALLFILRKGSAPLPPPTPTPEVPVEQLKEIEQRKTEAEQAAALEHVRKIREIQEQLKAEVDNNPTLDDVLVFLQDTSKEVHDDEAPPTDPPTPKPTLH